MNLSELHAWIRSDEGLNASFRALRRWGAFHSFGEDALSEPTDEPFDTEPDWPKLILAASILAESLETDHQEVSLMVAQTAMVFAADGAVRDAGALVLSQLSNHRAISLAQSRDLIKPAIEERLGVTEQILSTRRRLETSIMLNDNVIINANEFQYNLWTQLKKASWTSATAPTATGKTFLILHWMLREVARGACKLGVFLAPTRALVSELEKEFLELKRQHELADLRISSLPLKDLGDLAQPTLLVFTQERMHIFLNTFQAPPPIDIAVVDEVQKLRDGLRGVILQDAIERIGRSNSDCRFVFLSPNAENPEMLLEGAPEGLRTAIVLGGSPTVTQNLIVATQKPRKPMDWQLLLLVGDKQFPIGDFKLHDRPDSIRKRVSYVALALGRNETGTMIYASGADEAEKIAWQIYEGLGVGDAGVENSTDDEELRDLSDFCRKMIHPKFQLVQLITRGVAFHYGNMPSILRSEIERLFKSGKIKFLVCTSTLVEGVNLACRTIIVRGPRKGLSTPMSAQDFWNLAGRAGRWGADFHGNIVCLDVSDTKQWPIGVPRKQTYPIQRETDIVLQNEASVIDYINLRATAAVSAVQPELEHVSAYLMAWYMRAGSIAQSPPAKRLTREAVAALDVSIGRALDGVDLPPELVAAHPGISAIALHSLMRAFEAYDGDIETLLPAPPESSDAVDQLTKLFRLINKHLYPAFEPDQAILPFAFIAVDWMRGKPLGQMISEKLSRERHKGGYQSAGDLPYAKIIRKTMEDVEQIARFRSPKYLSTYLYVLRLFFVKRGAEQKFPDNLKYDLYLEFGVCTQTLLSLIGIGLSRTSAIALNEFLGQADFDEPQVLEKLSSRDWETLDLPMIVKREIRRVVDNQRAIRG